jgi:predicted dehydrogenase
MYRTAIIGAGKAQATQTKLGGYQIGYTHAAAYQRQSQCKLVAVADIVQNHLDAFNERFDATGYLDYRQMLVAERPDMVSICTYVGLHYEMLTAAAHAGVKAVLCEKPFMATPRQLAAVRQLVASTGIKIGVAHVRRYRPAFRYAQQCFNDGTIGTPMACLAGIAGWDLSEWGSHWIDMFRYLHNEQPVSWVMGQARVRELRGFGHAMEEHATLHMGFADGVRGILDGGQALAGNDIMTLVGSHGTIAIHDEERLTVTNQHGATSHDFTNQVSWDGCWDAAMAEMTAWMTTGIEPRIGFSHVIESAEVNLAAYLSAVHRDRIDLPLHDTYADAWPLEALAQTATKPQ